MCVCVCAHTYERDNAAAVCDDAVLRVSFSSFTYFVSVSSAMQRERVRRRGERENDVEQQSTGRKSKRRAARLVLIGSV